jgi:hypothetical protein
VPRVRLLAVVLAFASLSAPGAALAATDDPLDTWLPSTDGATWSYRWSNSAYSPQPRTEEVSVTSRAGELFRLSWKETGLPPGETPGQGLVDFRRTGAGLVNVNYQSSQPPPQFPVLCASAQECGNSLAGTWFALVWGSRSPVLQEPLLKGTRWSSTGGANNDVASQSRYVGRRTIKVAAFPAGVQAAEVESEITQGGALGDPFGSGVRTTWWVRGVGPVKTVLRHVGGEVTQSELTATSLKPRPLPSDANLFPLERGDTATYRWRNSKHMPRWSRQRFDVAEVVNGTARIDVKSLAGPIRVAGSYTFSRTTGVVHLQGRTRAQTTARFPALGPARLPAEDRRRFFTPFDLLVFGLNPVVPADASAGATWRTSRDSADFRSFGVDGVARITGTEKVRVGAGRFTATVIRSTLTQRGFRFGSGTRTTWLAPGKGLVKLVFRHADGSTSTVERVK